MIKIFGIYLKSGFTLAEVLITLGIIGVVASITVPVLMQKMNDYALKQAWKKQYSVISQAYLNMKQDEGGDLSGYYITTANNMTAPIVQELGSYLSIIKSCGIPWTADYPIICGSNPTINISNYYKTLSNNYVFSANLQQGQYFLKDGAQLYFRIYNPGWLLVWIDVNGYGKKPNALGKDLFGITITKDKIMPMGAIGTGLENTCNTTSISCPGSYGFDARGDCAGAGCSMEYLSQ